MSGMEQISINAVSPIIAAIVTALMAYGLTRASKGHDARVAAETALANAAPGIIAEQNKRISGLQAEMDRLWLQLNGVYERERKCQEQLSEYRHQVRDLEQKVVALEFKLDNRNT